LLQFSCQVSLQVTHATPSSNSLIFSSALFDLLPILSSVHSYQAFLIALLDV
jgi:hypothetical protein